MHILGYILLLLAVGLGLWLLAGAFGLAYISTHPPRRRVKRTPEEFGARYEDITFPARDGMMLSGWFVPARPRGEAEGGPRGAVILCHGMLATRDEVLPWAAPLWERGFTLLMFDFRAYGQSEGRRCTVGHHETQDLRGAVDYLAARPETAGLPVGVFGFSMGGATAILAAADDDRIQSVVTHGAFATLDRAVAQRCRHHFGLFAPLVKWMTKQITLKMGWITLEGAAISPIEAVARLTPRPLLLLHGEQDPIILASDARELRAAAGNQASLRMLPHSGHKRIHRHLRQAVRRRVAHFFSVTLHPATAGSVPLSGAQAALRREREEDRGGRLPRENREASKPAARN